MTDTQPIRNLKLKLAYDGTDFHGWQVQPTLPTVQGTLAQAIQHITGECVLPQGSGRTDAGVHAEGQVASFPLATPIPNTNLLHALNRKLPPSIRILSAETVPADFHARHSARGKTYQYRIFAPALDPARPAICPPTLARYVHVCDQQLNLAAMDHAAQAVIGLHDFTSFAASDPDRQQRECLSQSGQSVPAEGSSGNELLGPQPVDKELAGNVRTIFSSSWRREGQLFLYTVHGSGFLHHMVRNLVGSFLQAGLSRAGLSRAGLSRAGLRGTGLSGMQTPTIEHILAARDRSVAGPTAPASGLFLLHVDY